MICVYWCILYHPELLSIGASPGVNLNLQWPHFVHYGHRKVPCRMRCIEATVKGDHVRLKLVHRRLFWNPYPQVDQNAEVSWSFGHHNESPKSCSIFRQYLNDYLNISPRSCRDCSEVRPVKALRPGSINAGCRKHWQLCWSLGCQAQETVSVTKMNNIE